MKHLSKLALLVAALFTGLTAYSQTLTLRLGDSLEDEDYTSNFYLDYMRGDVSIAEGTYVTINMGTWHTEVMEIYMNDEVVYTKPSGSCYKNDVYHFTAGKNCKILGGSQRFTWENRRYVKITQDVPVNLTANSDGAATPSYWATYYNGTTSYTADANTTVYKAAMNGTSSLTLTEVADIPAGQAVILKSSSASITLTPAASTTADLSDNVLLGGTSVTSGYDAYTLSRGADGTGTVGFYKFNGGALDGSKAHLEISSSSPAPARGFFGFGDDGTTAIEAPTATIIVEDGEIYDLMGRRIEGQPTRKGIYVKNGQKFIVK